MENKVVHIGVRAKPRPSDGEVLVQTHSQCGHLFTHYLVDEKAATVECGTCAAPLNPMWVLAHLAMNDARITERRKAMEQERAALEVKRMTKCKHCQKMTRIRT